MSVVALLKTAWTWFTNLQSVQALLSAPFAKDWVYPAVLPAAVLISGIAQKMPVMWIIVAVVWCYTGTVAGYLCTMLAQAYKTPQNKLVYHIVYQHDLDQPDAPPTGNRQQRRSQPVRKLGLMELDPSVNREINRGQLGIEVVNNASFPISCILVQAATVLAGSEPPRTLYPKPAVTIPAGQRLRFLDDRIKMDGLPCQRLSGQLNMKIRYGRKGRENFELVVVGGVDIVMTEFGFVTALNFEPKEASYGPGILPLPFKLN